MKEDEFRFRRYESKVSELIEQLKESQPAYRKNLEIAETIFELNGNSDEFADFVEPSFRNFLVSGDRTSNFKVRLYQGTTLEFASPENFWERVFPDERPKNSRSARIFVTSSFRVGFLPNLGVLFGLNYQSKEIFYWTKNLRELEESEFSAPLRLNFLWWANSMGLQMLHAGAVGGEVGAVLIVGPSGRGKSTLSVASALQGGLNFVGDDCVLASTNSRPNVHSIYSSAKLDSNSLERFPQLFKAEIKRRGDVDKFLLDLTREKEIRLARTLPIKAVILPNFSKGEMSKLKSVDPSVVRLQLVPSTTIYSLGVERESFVAANKLIMSVPCFSYSYDCPTEGGRALRQGLIEAGIEI